MIQFVFDSIVNMQEILLRAHGEQKQTENLLHVFSRFGMKWLRNVNSLGTMFAHIEGTAGMNEPTT